MVREPVHIETALCEMLQPNMLSNTIRRSIRTAHSEAHEPLSVRLPDQAGGLDDAAQERGEVRKQGGDQTSKTEFCLPGPADIGLTHKDIHEARQIRDAERVQPGIARRAVNAMQ